MKRVKSVASPGSITSVEIDHEDPRKRRYTLAPGESLVVEDDVADRILAAMARLAENLIIEEIEEEERAEQEREAKAAVVLEEPAPPVAPKAEPKPAPPEAEHKNA